MTSRGEYADRMMKAARKPRKLTTGTMRAGDYFDLTKRPARRPKKPSLKTKGP